ncbi:MAG: penicillin acylase family protein [Halobaculum sp.]
MPPFERTRRAVLGLLAVGTPAVLASNLPSETTGAPLGDVLDQTAPLSGDVWQSRRRLSETVPSKYGPAEVTYDDRHVPHVTAANERAAYFALGYVHAVDRGFQMDLLRRRAAGRLAAVGGESFLAADEFTRRLGLKRAAEASVTAIEGTRAESVLAAYSDGVTAAFDGDAIGPVFELFGYEPGDWSVTDTALVLKQLSWQLSGRRFRAAFQAEARRRSVDASVRERIFPTRKNHDVPVVGNTDDTASNRWSSPSTVGSRLSTATLERLGRGVEYTIGGPGFVDGGSNAWVVSGDMTDHGTPVLCSDPHLPLTAPPLVYQQHLTFDGVSVRGGAVPGVPVPFVGETDMTTWGVTNAAVDASDVYSYETRDHGGHTEYRYDGEWRRIDTTRETIAVNGGPDRTINVRQTVHGPVLERADENDLVAVSWTGFAGTRSLAGFYRLTTATDVDEFDDALALIDDPTLNFLYADTAGRTLYRLAGRVPIRRVDGTVVRGDRVFDGSAGEAEWDGYEPYEPSDWEGFLSFDRHPTARDEPTIVSANQRPTDDPPVPLGQRFAPGLRARRASDLLDTLLADGSGSLEQLRDLQLDAFDPRSRPLDEMLVTARDALPDAADPWIDRLVEWDGQLTRDSRAALFFDRVAAAFKELTWESYLDDTSLAPDHPVHLSLPADSPVFDGDRTALLVRAVERALTEIRDQGLDKYGDINRTEISHLIGDVVSGLNYPRRETDGGFYALRRISGSFGAVYRLASRPGGPTFDVLPGGNDGDPYSDQYADQLAAWADGRYGRLDTIPDGSPAVRFRKTGGDDA